MKTIILAAVLSLGIGLAAAAASAAPAADGAGIGKAAAANSLLQEARYACRRRPRMPPGSLRPPLLVSSRLPPLVLSDNGPAARRAVFLTRRSAARG